MMGCSLRRASGFTLIELMVTLAIAAVLMLVAVPSFLTFKRNSELTSATNTLFSAINAARGEAMKRNTYALVVPTNNGSGTDWATGWVVFVDGIALHDRVYKADDTVILTQPQLPSYFTIRANGNAGETPAYVMYDGSGYAKSKGTSAFTNLMLTISRNDVTGNSTAKCEQTRSIVIDSVGRARVCKPTSNSDLSCPVVGTPC